MHSIRVRPYTTYATCHSWQALRVHLNDEFGEMRAGMGAAARLLPEGGRIGACIPNIHMVYL